MQMEYSSLVPQYSAPSSVSSASGSCEGRASRLRAVRLSRRAAEDAVGRPPSFGFSLRGGREHGTGFFVSAVEPGSEAHCRGLRVGDQIVRLNGFPLEDAIHREVLQLIQHQNFLTLKVRTVGMIPVKDKRSDPLTWRVVEEDDTPPTRPLSESSAPCQDHHHRDVRLLLTVPPRSKLGCGICKGPDWKPGIFVQFTKDNGIAKEVGLRPGDQVLQCNGITFRDITFSDAVHVLKSSRQLDLVIRKGAGLDLFPGESSGYNSSASSVNGDQSPSWEDTKRLSVVKEESMELEERLGQLETARGGTLDKDKEWDQIEYEWNKAERTEDVRRISNTLRSTTSTLKPSGASCTIIRVEENDAATTNGKTKDVNESVGRAEIRLVSQQQETTTVVVEVHRSEEGAALDEDDCSLRRGSDASPQQHRFSRPPAPPDESKCTNLSKSPSSSSFTSLASSAASSSLSSAISQELLRRSQKREEDSTQKGDDCKKEILKRINNEKRQQHEQLMEEFKRAHRKMFAHAVPAQVVSEDSADGSEQDRESPDHRRHEKAPPAYGSAEQAPVEAAKERELRPSKVQETANTERDKKSSLCQPPPPPPPPPPMPADEGDSTLKRPVPLPNGNASPPSCPTPDYDTASTRSSSSYSPTPSLAGGGVNGSPPPPPPAAKPAAGGRGGDGRVPDSVEMESLESFTLNNPALPDPKPPSTYFSTLKARKDSQSSSSSSTPLSSKDSSLKRTSTKVRPVSVTIGEYPSGMERKMPSKFNFLSGSTADVSRATLNPASGSAPISQLQSELVQTLSRSNLRKRTERQENLKGSTETTNGTVIIPVNSQPSVKSNSLSCNTTSAALLSTSGSLQTNHIPTKKPIITSNSKPCNIFQMLPDNKSHISSSAKPAIRDAAEKIANTFANNNRLTIKVANGTANTTAVNKQKDAIVDAKTKESINETPAHPNGILKNGTNFAWQNSKQPHATIVHQKSITFGKKTTIISDVAVSEN